MVRFKSCHPPAGHSVPASLPQATHLAPSPHNFPSFKLKAVVLAATGGEALDEPTITAAVSGRKPSMISLYLILRACEQRCHHFHFTVENSEGAESFSTWSVQSHKTRGEANIQTQGQVIFIHHTVPLTWVAETLRAISSS